MRVQIGDESGLDYGGPRNEWLSMLTVDVFDPKFGLFKLSSNGRSIYPSPTAFLVPNYLHHFRMLGRLLGKALIGKHF